MDAKNIHQRLRDIRKGQKLSQGDFAAMLGVTPSYVSAMELGKKDVTRKVVARLIELFKVSADWLISGISTNGIDDSDPLIEPTQAPQSKKGRKVKDFLPYLLSPENDARAAEEAQMIADHWRAHKGRVLTVIGPYSVDTEESVAELREPELHRMLQEIEESLVRCVNRIMHVQEMLEEYADVAFDDEAFTALKNTAAEPAAYRINNKGVEYYETLSFEQKIRYYYERTTLLNRYEGIFADAFRQLTSALMFPLHKGPKPKPGSAASMVRAHVAEKYRQLLSDEEQEGK